MIKKEIVKKLFKIQNAVRTKIKIQTNHQNEMAQKKFDNGTLQHL